MTPASPGVPVLVIAVTEPTVANLGLESLELGPQPWGTDGARITVQLAGDPERRVPVRVHVGDRPPRQALAGVGAPATLTLPPTRPGWHEVIAELDADELRADDRRVAGVRVAPVAAVRWHDAGKYVDAALATLRDNGRVRDGNEVVVGELSGEAAVIFPPSEPARLGALNRALEQRGVPWRYTLLREEAAVTDSGSWLGHHEVGKRYVLAPTGSGRVGVLATVAGAPWLVRSGQVVLFGSRLEPEWTSLPYSAAFLPFVDALVNRIARNEVVVADGAVGRPALLPDAVTEVRQGARSWKVEGGAGFRPQAPGVYWLLDGNDTVGALGAAGDPRESLLAPAATSSVEALWGARVVGPADGGDAAFALAARADLRGVLLWCALAFGLAELILAAWGGRQGGK